MTNKADSVTPPVQGENSWKVAGTSYATVGYIALPQAWKSAYLTLRADGDKWYYMFSTSETGNASASKTATSTVASNAFSAVGANVMYAIPDGGEKHFDMAVLDSLKVKTIILLSDAGAGYLEIQRSSGPVNG